MIGRQLQPQRWHQLALNAQRTVRISMPHKHKRWHPTIEQYVAARADTGPAVAPTAAAALPLPYGGQPADSRVGFPVFGFCPWSVGFLHSFFWSNWPMYASDLTSRRRGRRGSSGDKGGEGRTRGKDRVGRRWKGARHRAHQRVAAAPSPAVFRHDLGAWRASPTAFIPPCVSSFSAYCRDNGLCQLGGGSRGGGARGAAISSRKEGCKARR